MNLHTGELITLFRPFVTGFEESGQDHVVVYPTAPSHLLYPSLGKVYCFQIRQSRCVYFFNN